MMPLRVYGERLHVGWLRHRRMYFAIVAGAVAALLSRTLPSSWIERVYSTGIGRGLAGLLSWFSSRAPFSIAQVAAVVLAVGLLVYARKTWRVKQSSAHWVRGSLLGIVALASAGYALFVACWGLNYHRMPISNALRLPVQESTPDEVRHLARAFVAEMEAARRLAPSRDGVAALKGQEEDELKESSLRRKRQAMTRSTEVFRKASKKYPFVAGVVVRPKPIIGSQVASLAGIGGIYIPFTGEAHVNVDVPEFALPFNTCHEISHQRGVAREDEANFVGFVVARDFGPPDFQYSAYFGVVGHVIGALKAIDPELAHYVWERRTAALKVDSLAYAEWRAERESRLRGVTDVVNSAYLKSNGIADGAQSYGRVVDLLLAEQRAGRKQALPADP